MNQIEPERKMHCDNQTSAANRRSRMSRNRSDVLVHQFEERSEEQSLQTSKHLRKSAKRKWPAVLMTAAVVLTMVAGVLLYRDANRVIYLNGRALPTKNEMAKSYKLGNTLLEQGDIQQAIACYYNVDARSPYYTKTQEKLQQISDLQRDEKLSLAEAYAQNGAFDIAFGIIDEEYQKAPNNPSVAQKRNELEQKATAYYQRLKDEALTKAEHLMQQQDYSGAYTVLSNAIASFTGDEILESELAVLKLEYKQELMQRADALVTQKDYEGAAMLIDIALEIFPDDMQLVRGRRNMEILYAVDEAVQAENNDELPLAIQVLRNANITVNENIQAVEKLHDLERRYRSEILAEAQKAYAQNGYVAAARVVQAGMQALPNDEQLSKQLQQYLYEAPVDLLETLEAFASNGVYDIKDEKDNMGNHYPLSIHTGRYSTKDNEGRMSFYLGSEYSRLNGTAYLRDDRKDTKYHTWVEIYGDGILLYKSSRFTAQSLPESFDIDIKGVEVLEFVFRSDNYQTKYTIAVGNLLLYH